MVEWRPIPGLSRYEAGSNGRIRRVTNRGRYRAGSLIDGCIDPDGYRRCGVTTDAGKVTNMGEHRLVALAFHGEPPSRRHEIAHWDGVRANNVPSNLRWATCKENQHDRRRHGTTPRGERSGNAKLTSEQVAAIRRAWKPRRASALAREYGLSSSTVLAIVNGRTWSHVTA